MIPSTVDLGLSPFDRLVWRCMTLAAFTGVDFLRVWGPRIMRRTACDTVTLWASMIRLGEKGYLRDGKLFVYDQDVIEIIKELSNV